LIGLAAFVGGCDNSGGEAPVDFAKEKQIDDEVEKAQAQPKIRPDGTVYKPGGAPVKAPEKAK